MAKTEEIVQALLTLPMFFCHCSNNKCISHFVGVHEFLLVLNINFHLYLICTVLDGKCTIFSDDCTYREMLTECWQAWCHLTTSPTPPPPSLTYPHPLLPPPLPPLSATWYVPGPVSDIGPLCRLHAVKAPRCRVV